jgi:hypothetical protein
LTLLFSSCSSPDVNQSVLTNDSIKADSINAPVVWADSIYTSDSMASNPLSFNFYEINLDQLLKMLPEDAKVVTRTEPNIYDPSITQSVSTITFGGSTLEHTSSGEMAFISEFILGDNSLKLKRNIQVGDSYDDIAKKFDIKEKEHFGKIFVTHGDGESTLVFEFVNDRLAKISFFPYLG